MISDFVNVWTKPGIAVIPVNGILDSGGNAIMGKGVALQARCKHKDLPARLGKAITSHGNRVFYFCDLDLFTFPTKFHYRQNSDLALIERSTIQLAELIKGLYLDSAHIQIFVPRVGCGEDTGKLQWDQVKPVLDLHLRDQFDSSPGLIVYCQP